MQRVSEPVTPYTAWRSEDAALPKIIADSNLAVSWKLQGEIQHGLLHLGVYTVLRIRDPSRLLEQGFHTAFIPSGAVPVESVPRNTHHPTGFRDVLQFLGQVEKSDFVLDDLAGRLAHEGYLQFWLKV